MSTIAKSTSIAPRWGVWRAGMTYRMGSTVPPAAVESAALLSDSRGLLRPEYTQDFLHPNDAAYAVLNEALVKLLE